MCYCFTSLRLVISLPSIFLSLKSPAKTRHIFAKRVCVACEHRRISPAGRLIILEYCFDLLVYFICNAIVVFFFLSSRKREIVEFVTTLGSVFAFWHGKFDWICKALGQSVSWEKSWFTKRNESNYCSSDAKLCSRQWKNLSGNHLHCCEIRTWKMTQ